MKCIFKGAKFGDVFYTAGYKPLYKGDCRVKPQKAIFHFKTDKISGDHYYVLMVEGEEDLCVYDKYGRYCKRGGYQGSFYIDKYSYKPGEYLLDIITKIENNVKGKENSISN